MHTSLSLFIKVSSSLHARVARHRGVLTCNPKPMAARLWLDVDVGVDDAQGDRLKAKYYWYERFV